MDPTLPQTSPQGGPNPNSGQVGLSVLDLPSFGGSVDGALTGNARAAALANFRQQQGAALAPSPPPSGLPSYNPADPSLVATPANGVTGAGTPAQNNYQANHAAFDFDQRTNALAGTVDPGIAGAVSNWLFNKAGSPEANNYDAATKAYTTYTTPAAKTYLGQHPSLLAHAEADPVGFATKLGPILDAKAAAQNGTAVQGQMVHSTPDGPMIKPDDNVALTNAHAAAFGMTPQHAHAMTQPHHYTPQEFLAASEGVNNKQLQQMWEMQHYLNPAQQATSLALSLGAGAAKGQPMDAATQQYYKTLQAIATGPNFPLLSQ